MRLLVIAFVLATIVAGSFAGVVSTGAVRAQGEKVLVIVQQNDPGIFNNILANTIGARYVHYNVWQELVHLSYDSQNITYQLANSVSISSDGLNYTFHLRPGLKWSDGVAFTADDVKYTFDEAFALPTWGLDYLLDVNSTHVDDPYNISFVLKGANAAWLPYFAFGSDHGLNILPKHLYEGTNISTNPNNFHPISLGPFLFDSYTPGQSITLAANPNYWGGKPTVDKVLIKILPSSATALQELQSGDLMYVGSYDNSIAYSQIPPVAATPNIRVDGAEWPVVTLMLMNTKDAAVGNVTLRQAIGYAINRTELATKAFYDYAFAMNGFYLNTKWYNPAAELAYNPTKATQLLDQLGYPQGTCRVNIELSYHTLFGMDVEAQVIKSQLAEVGICATLWSGDYATWFQRVQVDGNYQIALRACMIGPDPDLFWPWLNPLHQGESGSTFFNNTAMNNLFSQARQINDFAQRKSMYDQVQQILHDNVPLLLLTNLQDVNLWRTDLVRNMGAETGTNRWDLATAELVTTAAPSTLDPFIVTGVVIVVIAAVGGIVWWRVSKGRASKAKLREPPREQQPPQGGPPGG